MSGVDEKTVQTTGNRDLDSLMESDDVSTRTAASASGYGQSYLKSRMQANMDALCSIPHQLAADGVAAMLSAFPLLAPLPIHRYAVFSVQVHGYLWLFVVSVSNCMPFFYV